MSGGPRPSRRALLTAMAAAPLAALAARVDGRDYGSAAEVFAAIDRLEADLDARLAGLSRALPAAAPFAGSVRADHERHRRARAALRRALRLAPAREDPPPPPVRATLGEMRTIAQDLVHAHAEGLPALRDAAAVDALARDMVEDARHLAVLEMWLEAEDAGG